MKSRSLIITWIVLLIIIIVILTGIFITLLSGKQKGFGIIFGTKVSNKLVIDETYDNDINSINVVSQMSEIYFKESNTDNIRVVIYGNKEDVDVQNNSGKLNINVEQEACHFLCIGQISAKIEVYLPESYMDKIKIDNAYGDVKIGSLLNANMDIKVDCGDIEVLGANKLDIDSAYGDITIKKVAEANINADCGDIEIDEVKDIRAKSAYGDIEIDNVTNYLNIENDCGDIELKNIILNQDSFIKNDFGDIEIGNTNEIYIDADTDLGKVKIKQNFNKSEVTLKIENDCGDIEVNN